MFDNIVGIRFNRSGRTYNFDAGSLTLTLGQAVIVETEQGLALGVVRTVYSPSLLADQPNPDFQLPSCPRCCQPEEASEESTPLEGKGQPPFQEEEKPDQVAGGELVTDPAEPAPPLSLKKILRIASPDDLKQAERNQEVEKRAMAYCRQKVAALNMNMALVRAECLFDRSKVVVYFTSEERLDFRELVHDLAAQLKIKVELRQIGVRQETKMLGGLGSCGRELCCAHVLREFNQVGVKMAKEQSLSLNPAKISGLCGRLMCCLGYEFETYRSLCKAMPKVGKKVKISPELEGKVLRHSPLTSQLTLLLSDGRTVTCTMEEMMALEPVENPRRNSRVALPKPLPQEQAAPVVEKEASSQAPTAEGEKPKSRKRRSRGRRKNKKSPAAS